MKISTKGRYGLRALIDLAVNSKCAPVSISCIAKRQVLSENYLEHVFSALRKADIVKSVKGAGGGYVLSDSPSNIKAGTILTVLEGNLSIADMEDNRDNDDINMINSSIKKNLWDKINKLVEEHINNVTLLDLVEDYLKMKENSIPTYYI